MSIFSFKINTIFKITFSILLHIAILPLYSQVVIIKDFVADLKIEPIKEQKELKYPIFYPNNPKQDSQLLLGEPAYVLDKKMVNNQQWLKIFALEQIKYKNNDLSFQTGWIKESQTIPIKYYYPANIVVKNNNANIKFKKINNTVSIGTKLFGIPINEKYIAVFNQKQFLGKIKKEDVNIIDFEITSKIRNGIVNIAKNFLKTPYSWGGRSSWNSKITNQQTGVDCSGFINLVYRTCGFQIPRDAHDQYLFSNKIKTGKELKKGDLIFLSNNKKFSKINHVMLYLGDNKIQESIGVMILNNIKQNKCYANRITTIEKKFGTSLEKLKAGKKYKNKYVYFGSILNSKEKNKLMRNNFLGKNLIFK